MSGEQHQVTSTPLSLHLEHYQVAFVHKALDTHGNRLYGSLNPDQAILDFGLSYDSQNHLVQTPKFICGEEGQKYQTAGGPDRESYLINEPQRCRERRGRLRRKVVEFINELGLL